MVWHKQQTADSQTADSRQSDSRQQTTNKISARVTPRWSEVAVARRTPWLQCRMSEWARLLYVFHAVLRRWRGDDPNGAILLDRADSPGVPTASRAPILIGEHLPRTRTPAERPQPMPSGESAPLSASTGTGCLRAERLLGDAEQREHLTLQIGELDVEDLYSVSVAG
jgi:hypothetical protein